MTEKMAKMGHKKVKVAGDKPEHRVQVAVTADTNRLVPLAEGRFVYYHDPLDNSCKHLDTRTNDFAEALRPACALGLGPRIRRELEEFHARWPEHGWDKTLIALALAEVVE
jgi:hypothetical protein